MVTKEIKYFKKTNHRVLCQGLNALNNEEKAPELVAQDTDIEQKISIQELIDEIKRRCPGKTKTDIIDLYLDDVAQADIAASRNCSVVYIRSIITKMKSEFKWFALENKDSLNSDTSSTISFNSVTDYEIEHEPESKDPEKPKPKKPENKKVHSSLNNEPKDLSISTITNPPPTTTKELYMKNKNHHAIAKVRPLSEGEIKKIRDRFIELDGVIPDDTWADLKKTMSKDISVFQITGQVVRLHREVAQGTIALKNKRAYTAAIQARRDKWKTYNSKKYREFAARTGARVKKVTNAIVKRVKTAITKKTKQVTPKNIHRPTVTSKTVCLRILKKDNTFETKNIETAKPVKRTDIPKLLNWKSVPKDVLDYMVVVA
jgi:hypothetical protein